MIAGHVELVSGLRVDPKDLLGPVRLRRHDGRDPAGVVHLGAHPVLLDELPDGDQAVGGADERSVRLAGAALLGRVRDADVEPHRRVERGLLVDEQVRQLVGEDLGIRLGAEVVVLLAPAADRVDHAGDELADRGLALRRAERSAEVFLGDDVGGVLRPADGELHTALLEGVPALLEVGDDRVARLPFDLVERVGPLGREVPPEGEPLLPDHLYVLQVFCSLRHLRRPPLATGKRLFGVLPLRVFGSLGPKPFGEGITPVESQGCNTPPGVGQSQAPFSYIWGLTPTLHHNMLWFR